MYDFSVIDYLVLIPVLVISISIGLYHAVETKWPKVFKSCVFRRAIPKADINIDRDRDQQLKEYLIANSSMNALPIAFSLLATSFSATALLGIPAEVYQFGIIYMAAIFGKMTTPLIGAFLTGPLFARLKVMSVFEYFKLRYDSTTVRLMVVTCYFIRSMISLAIFIYGPSTTITTMTSISVPVGILVIGAVSTFYTTIGGIKAVIWSDVFQLIIMLAGLVVVISKGLYDLDGFSNFINNNEKGGRLNYFDFDPNPFIRGSTWSLYFGFLVYFSMPFALDQQMVQRFAAAKNVRAAQAALLLNVPGIFILTGMNVLCGLVMYATYANCDPLLAKNITGVRSPNQLVSYFVTDRMKMWKGVAGLFLSAVLSGSLSSISSVLNSLSGIILEDFLKRFSYFKTLNDTKTTLTAKIIVVVCGVLGTGFALIISNLGGNLVQLSTSLNGAFNSPLIGVFILACVFPFTNSIGAIGGLISGFAMALWISFGAFIKKPIYPMLKSSVDCYGANFTSNVSSRYLFSSTNKEAVNMHGADRIYSLSYAWFSPVGAFTTVLIGIIISLLTGCNKKTIHSDLIVFKYLTRFQRKHESNSVKEFILREKF